MTKTAKPPRGLAGFAAGFSAPWTGLRYMRQHPRLWRHAFWPILCNLLLSILLLASLAYGGTAMYRWLEGMLPSQAWWWDIVRVFTGAALVIVILAVALAGWLLFQGILCGYFYSELAREVELLLGMKPEDIREVPLWYQVVDACLDLAFLGSVAIGCFVLGLIPLVGAPLALVLGSYFNCFAFGIEYLDHPQALRAYGRRAQREFARRHRGATLGLGASVALLTFVPIVNSVLLTTATTGAVLLYRRLEPASR